MEKTKKELWEEYLKAKEKARDDWDKALEARDDWDKALEAWKAWEEAE